jgi:hypothetical protein
MIIDISNKIKIISMDGFRIIREIMMVEDILIVKKDSTQSKMNMFSKKKFKRTREKFISMNNKNIIENMITKSHKIKLKFQQ